MNTQDDGAGTASKPRRMRHGRDVERAPSRWIYENLTPWRIEACFGPDGEPTGRDCGCVANVLSIPALGQVTIPHDHARTINSVQMRRFGQIELRPAPSEMLTNLPTAILIFGWLAAALVFGGWALFDDGGHTLPWAWVVASVVAVPVFALLVATAREVCSYRRFRSYRVEPPVEPPTARQVGRRVVRQKASSLEGVERGSGIRTFVEGLPRQVTEAALLIGVLLVSVGGLAVAIHLTTQLQELLPVDYGALLHFDNPFTKVTHGVTASSAFWQLLIGHIAQWVLASIAALAPAAMYFQFDRQRLAAVQRRWLHEVFRLDPTVRTVRDVEAKYGSQIESAFGGAGSDSRLRLRGGRRSPVIVATILLVVGWFLVISTTQVPRLVAAGAGVDQRWSWPGSEFPVASFFAPSVSTAGYAFLGAYVFSLFHVLRGYQRRDLRPTTYNTIVVRILSAYALALLVGIVYHGEYAGVVLFFVGFMPQSALVWLRELIAKDTGLLGKLPLDEPAPLTDLEGIDLYDRTRLAEEGINNVEALAHADIVELMSSTRIPAAELVDWVDQAILYLRVGGDAQARCTDHTAPDGTRNAGDGGAGPAPDDTADECTCPDVHRNLCHLRSFGIRRATDLMQAYEHAVARGHGDEAAEDLEVGLLRVALELPGAPHRNEVSRIQMIIDALQSEEWFTQLRNWRSSDLNAVDAWQSHLDGTGWSLTRVGVVPGATATIRRIRPVPTLTATPQPASVDDPAA